MLVRVADKRIVNIANIKKFAYERQGWRKVTEGRVGMKQYTCSCANPCGYRAFPGIKRIRDLMWSDVMGCWRRYNKTMGVLPGAKDSIEVWTKEIGDLQKQTRRLRDAGMVTKSSPVMLLARIPGPVIRGLAHDFPNEFSPTVGARSENINYHLERALDELYISREHGKPIGACVPKGTEGTILCAK